MIIDHIHQIYPSHATALRVVLRHSLLMDLMTSFLSQDIVKLAGV